MANKAFKIPSGDLYKFDPDDLVLNITDERAALPVLESLVLDIMVRGVVEPVIVGKGDDGTPYVIDGRQRVKAAREAKQRLANQGSKVPLRVPAVYRRGDALGDYVTMIAANEHRQDDDPLGKAKKLERFLGLGGSENEAAVAFGVTRQTITNWGKLLNLAPAVKRAVQSGKLGATAASMLADIPKADQADALELLERTGRKPTVKRAAKVAKKKPVDGHVPRVRSRTAIEHAMAHNPIILEGLSVMRALHWVLGRDVEGLER